MEISRREFIKSSLILGGSLFLPHRSLYAAVQGNAGRIGKTVN